jgi:hypothetical protein
MLLEQLDEIETDKSLVLGDYDTWMFRLRPRVRG